MTACLDVVHHSGRQVEIRLGSRADSTADKLSIGSARKRKSGFIPVFDQFVEEGTAEGGRVWDGEW